MIGRAISHYRVLSALGSGGMGIVYLAEDERLGRQVALKFLPPDSVKNRQALDRFRIEARAASSLSHPGICAIYDIGDDEGTPFIVMEALKGENLRDRINRGPMKIGELVDVGIQLADALEAAHTQGIIHRDIKPSNIFVGEKNRVKILDFGLAKLASGPASAAGDGPRLDASTHQTTVKQITLPGSALGTVSYMSPEQARGEDVDTRTDLFSLGTVLYEMATGTQAFGGTTPAVVFDAILNHTPVPLLELNHMVPPRLEQIISTLLEKDRELRYQHASDLQAELKRLRRDLDSGTLVGVGSTRTGMAAASSSRPPSSRQIAAPPAQAQPARTWQYAVGALALLIAAGLGFTIWSGRSPQTSSTVSPTTPTPQAGPVTPPPAPVPATSPTPTPLPTAPVPAVPPDSTLKALRPPVETKAAPPPTRGATPTPSEPAAPAAGRTAASQTTASVPAPATPPPAPVAPPTPSATEPTAVASQPQPQPAPARPTETPAPAQPAPVQPAPAQPSTRAAAPSPDTLPPTSPVESDDAAIRRIVATYKTAIETKNVGLYRSVRPGLTIAEETRLRDSFRQVESQQITISIDEIRIDGRTATVRLSRQDVAIMSGGRRQTQSIRQTLRLEKPATGWIITAIGG